VSPVSEEVNLGLDIYVGVDGSYQAVAALGEVEEALLGVMGRGPGTVAVMESIAKAAARMDGILTANAGGAESAARGLALLKGEAAGLREAYAQIAAANLDLTPEQRLELFGPEQVAAAKAAMGALRVSLEGDLEAVENKARASGEAMERALSLRGDAKAQVAAERYETLLAAMTPLEAATQRLADAKAREAAALAAVRSAQASTAATTRHHGEQSVKTAEAIEREAVANRKLADAIRGTRGAQSALTRETERAGKATKDMGDETRQAEVRVQALQYALFYTSFTLTAMGTVGVRALKAIFGAMIEVEKQFAQVNRTVEGYSETTKQALLDITTEIPASIESVAEIAALGGALNINAGNIAAFTRVVSILTATTNLTEQAAGTLIGRMDALLDLSPDGSDFEKIGAAVLSVGAQSAATETQVAAMAAQVAGLGKNVGLTAPQIIGWSGALASVGVSAELGRSSLQRIFNVLNKDVRRGGVELELLGKITGQTGAEFRDSLGTDASGALLSVVKGLNQMTASGQDTVQVLNALGVRNVRDVYSLQQLAAAYDNTTASLKNADDAYNDSAATLDRYYGPIAETTASRVQILESVWTDFLASMGDASQGPLNDAIKSLTNMVETVKGLVENEPEMVRFALNAIAIGSAFAILAGAVALAGSGLANFLFVKQQLIVAISAMNAAHLPRFITNMLVAKGVMDASTVSAQRAAVASTTLGARVSGAAKAMASATVWTAAITLSFTILQAAISQLVNAISRPEQSFEDFYRSIGEGDPIIAQTSIALNGISAGFWSIVEGGLAATEAVAKFLGLPAEDFSAMRRDASMEQADALEANELIMEGIAGAARAAEDAKEPVETWRDTLDDAGVAAAEAAGQTEFLDMALEEVPDAAIAATEALANLAKGIAESSGAYLDFGATVERSIKLNEDLEETLEGVLANPGAATMDQILAGMVSGNETVAAFQKNLAEIGVSGGQTLAAALSSLGPEKAAGIAEALVGNPELQRQFGIQARISGLLANAEFVRAFQEGSSDAGLTDAMLIEMAKDGASMETIFAAVEAASYGAGSEQWIAFVQGWNEANSTNPLTFDGFEYAPEAVGASQAAKRFFAMVQDELGGMRPDAFGQQVPFEVEIKPGFLFNQDDIDYTAMVIPFAANLQAELDNQTITAPMAFDQIALVNGYESWKQMVLDNPALAVINPEENDVTVFEMIERIKGRLAGSRYDVTPKVAAGSIASMIESMRVGLRNAQFYINVQGRVVIPGANGAPGSQNQGRVGVYGVARGGYIDQGGVGHFAGGGGWGLIRGRGTGVSDDVPAWLSKGEYVQTASAVSHYGVPMMDAIRSKSFPTTEDFASLIQKAMSVSGNQASGPQSVTNVEVVQNYPTTVNPLKRLREDSENIAAGLFG